MNTFVKINLLSKSHIKIGLSRLSNLSCYMWNPVQSHSFIPKNNESIEITAYFQELYSHWIQSTNYASKFSQLQVHERAIHSKSPDMKSNFLRVIMPTAWRRKFGTILKFQNIAAFQQEAWSYYAILFWRIYSLLSLLNCYQIVKISRRNWGV